MTENLQKKFSRVHPGDLAKVQLPHSEVCMHMKVAGKVMWIKVLSMSAQILNEDGSDFSLPITYGEAGVYNDQFGLYVWEVVGK